MVLQQLGEALYHRESGEADIRDAGHEDTIGTEEDRPLVDRFISMMLGFVLLGSMRVMVRDMDIPVETAGCSYNKEEEVVAEHAAKIDQHGCRSRPPSRL
jgi:hypothetical protein